MGTELRTLGALLISSILVGPSFAQALPGSCPVDRKTLSKHSYQAIRQRAIVGEMRGIAEAIECFGAEHHGYPAPTASLIPLSQVQTDLVPRYQLFIPTSDAWGSDYLFWSNGVHYVLISTSGDVAQDRDYGSLLGGEWSHAKASICRGVTDNPEQDLVFVDGQFCSWLRDK